MAPSAKRKRNIVLDDGHDQDDERRTPPKKKNLNDYFLSPGVKSKPNADVQRDLPPPDATRCPSPVRKSSRLSRPAPPINAAAVSTRSRQFKPSASKSPSNSPVKSNKFVHDKGKSANIRTLFSNQSQKKNPDQNQNDFSKKLDPQALDIEADPLPDDNDDDDDDDDENVSLRGASESSQVGRKAHMRAGFAFESDSAVITATAANSQRFLRPLRSCSSAAELGDQRPWSERFGPANIQELAVHPRKVAHVRTWLQDVLSDQLRQRLLVLKGAAGTGKTTTMHLLASEMGFEILEWRNPGSTLGSTQGAQPASLQFEEFLGRGRKFGQLDVDQHKDSQASSKAEDLLQNRIGGERQKVILIEDFPNTFMRSGSALTAFRKTILQFLTHNTPSLAAYGQHVAADPVIPIVMVVSETLLTTTSASADSFTAHRLLGPELLRHPGTAIIDFRNIAPTLLAKALELVVKKEARVSGRRRTPGPQVLKRLGEIGDIRNAVSSLQFLCLRGDDADWGAKVTFTKTNKASKDKALTKSERQSLQLISHREASLGIFHAVGKVVYNKRDEQPFPSGSEEATAEDLPSYMSHLSRVRRSEVSVGTLIDETGTDTSTFISALHENYALSCERSGNAGPNSSMDYINGCTEHLSDGDLLNPTWDNFFGGRGFLNTRRDQGSHILRQDEMAFEVAVRGLLFSLPHPVKRKSASSGRGGDPHKIYYPTSIKLWREKEELEGLVDLWASQLLKGQDATPDLRTQQVSQDPVSGASMFRKSKTGSFDKRPHKRIETDLATKPEAAPLFSLGSSARQEMVLERLPYMAHMMRRRQIWLYSLGLGDLEKVVSFRGIGTQLDEETDEGAEDEAPVGGGWATDKPAEEESLRKKCSLSIRRRSEQSEGSMISSLQMQKLVLSDDDIEDD
ncbi:unnamed protein product [Discula destructiva]